MKNRPQLQQQQRQVFNARFSAAVQILQMPVSELADEIREFMESNPLLEEIEPQQAEIYSSTVDFSAPTSAGTSVDSDAFVEYAAAVSGCWTVRDYLHQQLLLSGITGERRIIAQAIIESIDERGYLAESLASIQEILADRIRVSSTVMEQVLHCVQGLGPNGIAARNLRESLLLQLEECEAVDVVKNNAIVLVDEHFELLTETRFADIEAATSLSVSDINHATALIRSLNPHPGNQFGVASEAVVPDLIAQRVGDKWRVQLNSGVLPRLGISPHYRQLMDSTTDSSSLQYLQKNLDSATTFLDNVKRRHETLLNVAKEIVRQQHAFLDRGQCAMQPLKISDVAERLDLHESTVSRACAQKYIMTPRGTYELRRLFSVRIPNRLSDDDSADAIKYRIGQLVQQENARFPLSDSQITNKLRSQGSEISRRTVAKYRCELYIPAYQVRKRMTFNQAIGETV